MSAYLRRARLSYDPLMLQKAMIYASSMSGSWHAFWGVISASVGGLFIAQAGGSEFFLSLGFLLGTAGALGIVIGGVAIGVQLARD